MLHENVVAIAGKIGEVGDQVRVDPGMHSNAGGVGSGDDQCQRIEVGRLVQESVRARLPLASVVGVASSSYLDHESVYPRGASVRDQFFDCRWRGEGVSNHPEAPNLTADSGFHDLSLSYAGERQKAEGKQNPFQQSPPKDHPGGRAYSFNLAPTSTCSLKNRDK